jgi:hypothetical protein
VKIASDAANLAQTLRGLLENETAVPFVDGKLDNGVIHHNELGRRCNVDALMLPHGLEVPHRLLRALRVGAIPVPSDVLPVRAEGYALFNDLSFSDATSGPALAANRSVCT